MKYLRNIKENNVSVVKNILFNNGTITAYYVINPFNYTIFNGESTEKHIQELYNVISNLQNNMKEVKLSIFNIDNIVRKAEVYDRLNSLALSYSKKNLHPSAKNIITNIRKSYTILAVNIDILNKTDIENQTIASVIKGEISSYFAKAFSVGANFISVEEAMMQNSRIYNILQTICFPATEEIIMNIYMSRLYPSYNLLYTPYMIENSSDIMTYVSQELTPGIGYFEMSNSGLEDVVETDVKKTYGSVIDILNLPAAIESSMFNMNKHGMCVNLHLMPQEEALLKFKRMRSGIKEEGMESIESDDEDTDIAMTYVDAKNAIKEIKRGKVFCEADIKICVTTPESKEALNTKKKRLISELKSQKVVASIASNQAKQYVKSFIKHSPESYRHVGDLEFFLSFQMNNGSFAGDGDSVFPSPVIGDVIDV